ncbi:MAG: hypothetical protein Q9163_000234 [Psora crenata]
MAVGRDERTPLLQNGHVDDSGELDEQIIDFADDDPENPRNWTRTRKMVNVGIISLMSVLSPLASSMFTPGISQIAEDLQTAEPVVVGATTGFVFSLGIGHLILAPLSETFGRRMLYLVCFSIFTLSQIPTALSPNVGFLIAARTVSGFFGSVGIANGGGTISDMFRPSERAAIFGWYLLGPLLGPTLGPLFGGLIVQNLSWRWLFWILTVVCAVNTFAGFLFLKESYAPVILVARKRAYEEDDSSPSSGKVYRIANQDDRPLLRRLLVNMQRPLRILFTQPIVFIMAIYQAILFGTTYSLWTNFEAIYGKEYGFTTTQVGLTYLGIGIGFLIAVWFIVPKIDTVYNRLTEKNDGKEKPEYRLPLANIGAVLVPISLFWFAWTVEYHIHWSVTVLATVFFGLGQITILNTVQNYYIDSFSKYAASAIAAGAVFRSIAGGVLPMAASGLFEALGYGWGVSIFAFLSLTLSPAPSFFIRYGGRLREMFAIEV